MGLTTSSAGIALIKKNEGCVLKVYLDVVGIKTVGYGHTGSEVNALPLGYKITQDQADLYLKVDLKRFENNVNKYYSRYIWTQNEFDALVDFAYNVGSIDQLTANGTRSKRAIADMMLAYDKAKGKVIPALSRRRKEEREIFLMTETSEPQKSTYDIGRTYKLNANMCVRDRAAGSRLKYDSLTENAKKNASYNEHGEAILKKDTKVTCKGITTIGSDIWMEIPSGYVCAVQGGKVYIE